jgi:putative phosphoesterase
MRIAVLYDIHGNLPALEAVLDDVARPHASRIVVGGDVLPGPMGRECLDLLLDLDLPVAFIRGNGDRVVLAQIRGEAPTEVPDKFREDIRWSAAELTAHHKEVLASWPATIQMQIYGVGRTLFCHATPRNDTDVFTRATPAERVAPLFAGVEADVVICGHTHMQFDRMVGTFRVVNAGSVGMPFGESAANWLLLGPNVELRKTRYDLVRAADLIRRTAYPHASYFAENSILHPPSQAEMVATFEKTGG